MRRSWGKVENDTNKTVTIEYGIMKNDGSRRRLDDLSYMDQPEYKERKSCFGKVIAGLLAVSIVATSVTGVAYYKQSIQDEEIEAVAEAPTEPAMVPVITIEEEPKPAIEFEVPAVEEEEPVIEAEPETPEDQEEIKEQPSEDNQVMTNDITQTTTTVTTEVVAEVPETQFIPENPEVVEEQPQVQEIAYQMPSINFDGVSEASMNLYYQYLAYEPQQVLNVIAMNGVPINVAPSGKYTDGSAGLYRTDYCSARSINVNCSTDKKLKMAVNHEIGHCVDELIGQAWGIPYSQVRYQPCACVMISNCDEFQEIYAAEVGSAGYPSWNSNCAAEFFAETYRYVVEGNTTMMAKAPRAAEFVKRVVNEAFQTNL